MKFRPMMFAYWMLATIGVQVLIGVGLALCLGAISPADSATNTTEERIYSAIDAGAFFVAMSSPAIIASAATHVVALRRRTRVVSSFVLSTTWSATPLLLFVISLNAPFLYLAVLQMLAGILMTRIANASNAFGGKQPNTSITE